ncbi:MAG TPA: enoyl-CoA hydratase/isomerase family protein [Candidatus Corynebacterium avicola]|uniref:3-hydroxyisobutyryl-CoA hydrolase n=1 Tax=Candidatus Corynebacterium avicola TaxID=2838527 RepID=A0A9D1RNK5_9CORY|nr:enoyl-CoA hydratase/isomerase family protein [Candidatus Corynebacterium avicola]
MNEITHERVNNTGVITLDRPKALNALNHAMITSIAEALEEFRKDDAVEQVVLRSAVEKAYCSGGDVRSVRETDLDGEYGPGDRFFDEEYVMNHALADFPKPTVALVNGITMGGGLGVSAHADQRVITPRTWESMPEMAIGFVTDVGISHVFTHLPHVPEESRAAVGLFLAVTAYRLTTDDLLWTGLGTHLVEDIEAVAESLQAGEQLSEPKVVPGTAAHDEVAGRSELARNLGWITETFSGSDWREIAQRIETSTGEFVDATRELLAPANPLSLVAAAVLLDHSSRSSLREALDAELAIGSLLRRQPNFAEGVRAVLVDKDRDAHFVPASVAEVTDEQVAEFRTALG